ncbi:MAG: Crp/Fnr family transcriptional regulator [Acidimicrobiia bacterium]
MDWPILSSLGEEDRRHMLASTRRRRFARREVLFHEGDPGDTLHLIDKGRVAVRITTPLGDVATLSVLGPGECVGEMALLGSGHRGATVVALEKTETLSLHRDQFEVLRRDNPAVDRFLIDVLAAEVRRLDGQLMEALFLPVERRVLRRLIALTGIYSNERAGNSSGTPQTPGGSEIPLTQDDLASLAGTSRATVNRVLRQAEEAGWLALGRGRIRIIDHARLARRAH